MRDRVRFVLVTLALLEDQARTFFAGLKHRPDLSVRSEPHEKLDQPQGQLSQDAWPTGT